MSNAARVCQTSVLRSNMNDTKDAFDLKLWEKYGLKAESTISDICYFLGGPKYILNVTKDSLT